MAVRFLCPVLAACFLVACGDDDGHGGHDGDHADAGHDCEADTRDEEFVAGMSKTGSADAYTFTLVDSTPAPPDKGDNAWTLELTDAEGAPVDGVDFEVEPFMPDHAHGTPKQVVVTPMGDGLYGLDPVNLFMPGLWEITVRAVDGDTTLDSVVFRFCISG